MLGLAPWGGRGWGAVEHGVPPLGVDQQPGVFRLAEYPCEWHPPQPTLFFGITTAHIRMYTWEPEFLEVLLALWLYQILTEKPPPLID
jgi:hypothetical protein